MQIIKPFTYLFRQPRALSTIGVGSVMMFIPVVGQIALHGWLVTVYRALLEGREEVPPLSFQDFSQNLQIGIGPWLVTFVMGFVTAGIIMPVYSFFAMGFGVAIPLMNAAGAGETVMIVMSIFFAVLMVMIIMTLAYLGMAATNLALMRAELAADVGRSFTGIGPGSLLTMARGMKKELFQSTVAMAFGGSLATFVGMLALYFGIFPAVMVTLAAGAHFRHQLYSTYLARGGTPFPIYPLPGETPAPPASPGAPVPYGG